MGTEGVSSPDDCFLVGLVGSATRGLSVSYGWCGGCCGPEHWAVGPGARTLTAPISCSPRTPASRLCFWTSCPHVARRLSAAVMSVPRT